MLRALLFFEDKPNHRIPKEGHIIYTREILIFRAMMGMIESCLYAGLVLSLILSHCKFFS